MGSGEPSCLHQCTCLSGTSALLHDRLMAPDLQVKLALPISMPGGIAICWLSKCMGQAFTPLHESD